MVGLLGLAAVAVGPVSPAHAVTLGNPDVDEATATFGSGCSPGPTCTYLQTRLPGANVRAPFTGFITKWRMAQPGPRTSQLAVMRKRDHGKFEAIRATDFEMAASAGTYRFDTHLRIRKGDYIALHGDGIEGRENPDAKWAYWGAPLVFGTPTNPDSTDAGNEYLYNATLRH
jgi:hypothetical protein